jgi:hypothetical protein
MDWSRNEHDRLLKELCERRRLSLETMPTAEVKLLWDRYDGENDPDGFWGEEIHSELNRRSEGRYCAV